MDVYSVFARIMKFIIISDDMLFSDSSSSFIFSDFLKICILLIVIFFVLAGFMYIDWFWSTRNKCSKNF